MSQILLPVGVSQSVSIGEIARLKSFGAAMELCASAAGFDLDKVVQTQLKVDKGQFARWKNGSEGIKEEKFNEMQNFCGNDIPLLYLNHSRGYDITSLHKRESEIERKLREAEEKIREKDKELDYLKSFVRLTA
jgi:hypothetical protein